jgi:hypothetical protein
LRGFLLSIHEDLIILDASRSALLGTGEIFESREFLNRTQIDNHQMRQSRTLDSTPVGRLLEIEGFVSEIITTNSLFAVSILNCPRFTTYTSTILAKSIYLCNTYYVFTIMGRKSLEGDISTLGRSRKTNCMISKMNRKSK